MWHLWEVLQAMTDKCAYCDKPAAWLGYCRGHYSKLWRLKQGLTDPSTHCCRCGDRTKVASVFEGYCYPCYAETQVA